MRILTLLLLLGAPPALFLGIDFWIVQPSASLPAMGLTEGRLIPCPPGIDCVSSEPAGPSAVAALPFEGDPDTALSAMLDFLSTESGAVHVEVMGDYAHAVFVRDYLHLVEDVELRLDREQGVFQIRAFERTRSPASGILARVDELAQRWQRTRKVLVEAAGEV